MSTTRATWRINTSGSSWDLANVTLDQAKRSVETACAPLNKGWSGRWEMYRPGHWYYRIHNSRGTKVDSLVMYRPDLRP